MLLGGDEIGRTQGGNNNGWCQDNEISWFDWELDAARRAPARVRAAADRAAARAPGLPPARLPHRRATAAGSGLPDAWWFRPDGLRMTSSDWNSGAHVLGLFLNGDGHHGARARRASGSRTTRSCCSSTPPARTARSTCPAAASGAEWILVLDTADPEAAPARSTYAVRRRAWS